jgi:hypothetical protein
LIEVPAVATPRADRKRLLQPGRLETSEVASGVVFIDARHARKLAEKSQKNIIKAIYRLDSEK